MKKYEIDYIIKPLEDEKAINIIIDKFEKLIKNNGGEVNKIDRWGKRRMAYLINNFSEGFYVIMYFTSAPNVVSELQRVMKITDDILRHMVIKEDD